MMVNGIIDRIVDEVQRIRTVTTEPGAEIAQNLSAIIDTIVKDSANPGRDLSEVCEGILIGAFRSNRSLKLEAHKTIHLLIQEIIGPVFNHKGDINKAIDGLLRGIAVISKEHELNLQEALAIAREDIFISVKKIDAKLADDIKEKMQKDTANI